MAAQETLIAHMPARGLINIVLAVLTIIVIIALLLPGEDSRQPATHPVSDIDKNRIDHIKVERGDEPDLEFRKTGGDWFLSKPIQVRARPVRIGAILNLPETTSHERLKAGQADLEAMLLEPPLLTVRLGEKTFHFGATDPINNRRYLLTGETVHLVADRLFHQLTQPAAFFTDVQLLPEDMTITQITYPEHVVLLENDRWRSRPGPVTPGTEAAVTVENWRKAQAQRVLTYRSNGTAGRIIIQTPDEVVVFDIVRANKGLLLARADQGIQYQLSEETASKLGLADYLREK